MENISTDWVELQICLDSMGIERIMKPMKPNRCCCFHEQKRRTKLFAFFFVLSVFGLKTACAASVGSRIEKFMGNSSNAQAKEQREADKEAPFFEQTASNVTAFEGQTVYLPCRVHNLADKVVSWMRSRDLHILTSGQLTFSSDERFKLQYLNGSDAWTLQLDDVKKSDAGRYECQVNTEPKMMYAVRLTVRDPNKPDGYDEPHSQQTRISFESTAPVAAIMGPRVQSVPAGSTITLKCVITSPYQIRPVKGVQWLRDNKLLTFQAARGGINVETVTDMAQTFSEATLANVTWQDTGNYSCRPTEGKTDTIFINVQDRILNERSEAMQRDATYTSLGVALQNNSLFLWFVYKIILNTLIHRNIVRTIPVLL